jgi:uncharacterized protein (DUF983 family)
MTADDTIATPGTSTAMVRQAMTRGFFGKCPKCGEGKMFRAFLKVADECPACGEPLHHQRADDFPAYIVIVLVGHIVVPLVLLVETEWAPPTWLHMLIWPALIAIMALSLLQPVKGAVVGLQWVLGMHGFEDAARARSGLAPAVNSPPLPRQFTSSLP